MLEQYAAWGPRTDLHQYQWRLRLLQSHWRAVNGWPMGHHRGRPRGTVLPMPEAKDSLQNYLTPTIRHLVRREVDDPVRSKCKLYGRPTTISFPASRSHSTCSANWPRTATWRRRSFATWPTDG